MRPCRRMSNRKYSTNNMSQNAGKNTDSTKEDMILSIQELEEEAPYCEDFMAMYEKNYQYMKSLCPAIVRKLQTEIDEECDKLEHSGSCMFDEWPDRSHLDAIIDEIYKKMQYLDKENPDLQAEEITGNPLTALEATYGKPLEGISIIPIPDYNRAGFPNWYRNLIGNMLFNEMLYRRMRYYNRRYYPRYWR